MKTIGIIPARAGSKGVPHKNMALCAGKPLIAWTLEAARKSKLDRIVVSTDDQDVLNYVASDVALRRPAILSNDIATMEDVVMHALWTVDEPFDAFVLLQPTSPLRTAEDIDAAIGLLGMRVVSVCESHLLPFDSEDNRRRQDRKPALMQNGAIYAALLPWLPRTFTCGIMTVPYVMPPEHSIDIDTPHDLDVASFLLSRR